MKNNPVVKQDNMGYPCQYYDTKSNQLFECLYQ